MKLNFRKIGQGDPVLILHGLFGSSDNWQSVAKELCQKFTCYLIDQRNHGLSPHDDLMNYEVMSDDLKVLIKDQQLGTAHIMGHSMGGKTAMTFATKFPELVDRLIIVDIGPKAYPPHHDQIFKGFRSVDLEVLKSRKEADDMLSVEIKDFGIRQFMLKNLNRNGEKFEWKINLDAIEANASEIGKALSEDSSFDGPALFLGGSKSDYIQPEDQVLISHHFPNSQVEMIDGAGHWVHAEKPKELLNRVIKFLS
ncbi:MAG: alpha/beta fold hydrolase [Cyclobacteriaceae bacterium]